MRVVENWPHSSPGHPVGDGLGVGMKVGGLIPLLASCILGEKALHIVGVAGKLAGGYECGRAGSTTCLLCNGQWREVLPYPPPLLPIAGRRANAGVMRAGELAVLAPHLLQRWGEWDLHLGSTGELVLDVWAAGEQSPGHEHRRVSSASCLLGRQDMGRERHPPPLHHPLPPMAGRRVVPGHQNRAGSGCEYCWQTSLEVGEWEGWRADQHQYLSGPDSGL